MSEVEPPMEVQRAAFDDAYGRLSERMLQDVSFAMNFQVKLKDFLLEQGYHDNWQVENPKTDETFLRNYYSFHKSIGSTPPNDTPFVDFPGDTSIIAFLKKELNELDTQT